MDNRPIKATAKTANQECFYLIQTNGADKRYVIWLRDKIRIRTILAGFINKAVLTVEVKIRDFNDFKDGIDYFGSVAKSELHQLMTKYEDVLFHNGYHDLMILIPETEEYIVFDEHGLIFIYTSDTYETFLTNLRVKYQASKKLIYEFDHWHYCLPNGNNLLISFIDDLKLERE